MTQKKNVFQRNFSIVLAVFALAFFCYFIISLIDLRAQVDVKQSELSAISLQVEKQQKKNEELERKLNDGDLDAFVEQRARDEDLGYMYPDERVYYDMAAGN